jgi:hypothetical protein
MGEMHGQLLVTDLHALCVRIRECKPSFPDDAATVSGRGAV